MGYASAHPMRPSRSAALTAIARAIDVGGDVDSATLALRRADPLLRRGARRHIRDAYVDALLSTQIKKGDDATRHVMRIAYLLLAGAPPAPEVVDDVDAVAAACEAARARRAPGAPRVWWATAIASLVLTLATASFAFTLYRAFGPLPHHDAIERAAPPPRGAFATGGKVLGNHPAVTHALAEDLPDYLI